jgi:hypothetical protein
MRSRCCLCVCMSARACVCVSPLPLLELGKSPLIVARQRLDKNPLGNGSVKIPPVVARQQVGRNFTAVTNTHVTIEELLDASF